MRTYPALTSTPTIVSYPQKSLNVFTDVKKQIPLCQQLIVGLCDNNLVTFAQASLLTSSLLILQNELESYSLNEVLLVLRQCICLSSVQPCSDPVDSLDQSSIEGVLGLIPDTLSILKTLTIIGRLDYPQAIILRSSVTLLKAELESQLEANFVA